MLDVSHAAAVRRGGLTTLLILLGFIASACGDTPTETGGTPNPPPPPTDTVPASAPLVNRAPIGAAGGEIRVDDPESPLNGLLIEVPPGSYGGTTEWSIWAENDVRPDLPEGIEQIGPTIRIRNGQGYADSAMVLRLPAATEPGEAVAAFYYERGSGTFEVLPSLDFDGEHLWVVTQHLSADRLLIPGRAPVVNRGTRILNLLPRGPDRQDEGPAGAAPLFGEVEIVVAKSTDPVLQGSVSTSFQPGRDDWEFPNWGSYLAPEGFCAGSSLTALYHHYVVGKPLFAQYDSIAGYWEDNAPGIRFATMVQNAFDWDEWRSQLYWHKRRSGLFNPNWGPVQAATLTMAMRVTGRAQLLGIHRDNIRAGGHALVAYEFSDGIVHVADPNAPGERRRIEYADSAWIPFAFSERVEEPEEFYTRVYAVGVSALVPMDTLHKYWNQFERKVVGDDAYPPLEVEYREVADSLWRPLGDTVRTASDSVVFRTLCETCSWKRNEEEPDESDRGLTIVVNRAGSQLALDEADEAEGAVVPLMETGIRQLGLAHGGMVLGSFPRWAHQDFSWIQVEKTGFELSASVDEITPGEEVVFAVDHGGLHERGFEFRWDFGDGSPEAVEDVQPGVRHTYDESGRYVVRVELYHADGGLLARDSLVLETLVGAWRGESTVTLRNEDASGFYELTLEATDLRFEAVSDSTVEGTRFEVVSGNVVSSVRGEHASGCTYEAEPVNGTIAQGDGSLLIAIDSETGAGGDGPTRYLGWGDSGPFTIDVTYTCGTHDPLTFAFQLGTWLRTAESGGYWKESNDPDLLEGTTVDSFTAANGTVTTWTWTWRFERVHAE